MPAYEAGQELQHELHLLPAIPKIREEESDDEEPHLALLSSDEALLCDREHIFSRTLSIRWWKIYLLHFLFMWNSRTFEFVSIILVASAYPDDLTATSIRGMALTLSSILFASSVGSWIDNSSNRILPLRTGIIINHVSIIVIYLMWMFWPLVAVGNSSFKKKGFFGMIIILDVVQTLSATGYNLSITRDWIPTLVTSEKGSDYTLTHVNAVIARVNLFCKVVSPLLLPVIISAFSRGTWIFVITLITISVWVIEMYILRNISAEHPQLRSFKLQEMIPLELMEYVGAGTAKQPGLWGTASRLFYRHPAQRLRHFFSLPVWPAAICMAFLYLTVLVYSAPLITYLLQSGMPLELVTIARASGSLMGFVATFTTPLASEYLTQRIGALGRVPRKLSSWGIIGQFLALIPVVLVLQTLSPSFPRNASEGSTKSVSQASLFTIITLFGFLSFSRFFHWMYELMEQELEQSEVPISQRSTFSGTAQAICSCFDLLHWFATVVWGRPEQFKGLATASFEEMTIDVALVEFMIVKCED
ncbi:hypothetical protein VTL71DRAFT_7493 [Oculimacula yallundae]|uniref:Solute carrier family 40 member n=1 Tax=Oculimacula yallundae TaxID=86028 RepID=A0ABR4BU99_9HELO